MTTIEDPQNMTTADDGNHSRPGLQEYPKWLPCEYTSYLRAAEELFQHHMANAFDGQISLYKSYVCRYAAYSHMTDTWANIEGYLIFIFGTLGFLGSVCTIFTLRRRRFRLLDFTLYRMVAYLETIQMLFMTVMNILQYVQCELNYTCTFLWAHVATTSANICSDAVDLVVLYLSVERSVACLLPHYFKRLHTATVYRAVIMFALCLPTFFSTLQSLEIRVVYKEDELRYRGEPSPFSRTAFYAAVVHVNSARFYMTAALICLSTVVSVFGFWSVGKRKNKLVRSSLLAGQQSQRRRRQSRISVYINTHFSRKGRSISENMESTFSMNQQEPDECIQPYQTSRMQSVVSQQSQQSKCARQNRQVDLCCLQLCLATPVIINLIVYASGLNTHWESFKMGEQAFVHNLTYTEAMREVDRAESFQYLRASANMSNVLAHALHFYLYMLFSYNMRSGFVRTVEIAYAAAKRNTGRFGMAATRWRASDANIMTAAC